MWFTETAWPPMILCLVGGSLLALQAYVSRRAIFAVLAVLTALLALPIWIIERQIVTEPERIEAAVYDMAEAIKAGDAERCLRHFSRQASRPSPAAIRSMVVGVTESFEITRLKITGLSIEMKSANTRAVARFRAGATLVQTGVGRSQEFLSRWELTWRREGDDWRVIKVHYLNARGEEQALPVY
jgi:ketosteroid isomerase-like protein